jgi:hypothetical protein
VVRVSSSKSGVGVALDERPGCRARSAHVDVTRRIAEPVTDAPHSAIGVRGCDRAATKIADEADIADSDRWKRRKVALRPARNDGFAVDVRDGEAVGKSQIRPDRAFWLSAPSAARNSHIERIGRQERF